MSHMTQMLLIKLLPQTFQSNVSFGSQSLEVTFPKAYATGAEGYGPLLYSCRAQFEGGVHPGKVRPKLGGCHIPYGGKEIIINSYEVLVASPVWVQGFGDKMKPRAIKTGKEAYGPALFSCRAKFERGMHPGKIRPGFGGCMVPFGGKEILVTTYEVLQDFY